MITIFENSQTRACGNLNDIFYCKLRDCGYNINNSDILILVWGAMGPESNSHWRWTCPQHLEMRYRFGLLDTVWCWCCSSRSAEIVWTGASPPQVWCDPVFVQELPNVLQLDLWQHLPYLWYLHKIFSLSRLYNIILLLYNGFSIVHHKYWNRSVT